MKQMKRVLCAACLLLAAALVHSQEAPSGSAGGGKSRFGMLFDITSLLGGLESYGDGFQSGVGLKYFFGDTIAARLLLGLMHTSDAQADTSATSFGLSLGGEYHFLKGRVSPYAAGFLGFSASSSRAGTVTTSNPSAAYLGLAGGAEVQTVESINLFFEYNALFVFGESFSIRLGQDGGIGKNVVLGLAVYF